MQADHVFSNCFFVLKRLFSLFQRNFWTLRLSWICLSAFSSCVFWISSKYERMKKRTREIQQRIDALRVEVDKIAPDVTVSMDDLLRRINRSRPDDDQISDSMLRYALLELRKDIDDHNHGLSLEIGRNYVRVLARDETVFDQNMQLNVRQKRAIAATLWNWLFDFPLPEEISVIECWRGNYNTQINNRVGRALEKKREMTRTRASLGLVVDAGSTNAIVVDYFLQNAPSVPFQIQLNKQVDGESVNFNKLVAPLFVTNSIVIADKIARSKFRHSIPLRVIGGTERPDRKSICGELALLWLRACHHEGKMTSLDLAIIGSTGIEPKRFGAPSLGCDSAEEASLKSRLLAMSHFRIALLDSKKVALGPANSVFASISEGDVDLIITDGGTDAETEAAVTALACLCDNNGVGLMVARIRPDK